MRLVLWTRNRTARQVKTQSWLCALATTAGCSKTHLPGYVQNFEKFKAAGKTLNLK